MTASWLRTVPGTAGGEHLPMHPSPCLTQPNGLPVHSHRQDIGGGGCFGVADAADRMRPANRHAKPTMSFWNFVMISSGW